MKTLTTTIAIAFIAFTARASEQVPYIAMPVGIGDAIDAKGVRHPNALCFRDAVFAPHPQYPYGAPLARDPVVWTRDIQGDGLYRLDVDLNTGRVSQVIILKSTGSAKLDTASTSAFKRWVFRPGTWKEIIIPTTVRKKWVAMRTSSR
jgi:TonB family protein